MWWHQTNLFRKPENIDYSKLGGYEENGKRPVRIQELFSISGQNRKNATSIHSGRIVSHHTEQSRTGVLEMKSRTISVFLAIVLTAGVAWAQKDNAPNAIRPLVVRASRHDISRPLRELAAQVPTNLAAPKGFYSKPIQLNPNRKLSLAPPALDPLLSETRSPALATTSTVQVVQEFEGVGALPGADGLIFAPPDMNGAVGESQYVQWTNRSFAIFEKATGKTLQGPLLGNVLWKGFGGKCEEDNDGDPVVQYDRLAKRWVLGQFAIHGGYYQCVAVSTTADATGSYNRYEFKYLVMDDYPKVAVWPDGYYASFNMFKELPKKKVKYIGAMVCAYDRNAMLTGKSAAQICYQLSSDYFGLLPSDADFTHTPSGELLPTDVPKSGEPNYFLALGLSPGTLDAWTFHVNWQAPNSSTFGIGPDHRPNFTVQVPAYTWACNNSNDTCITQPQTAQALDSLGDRLMFRLSYRRFGDHVSLYASHAVDSGGSSARAAIRWYELRNDVSTFKLFQAGTFSPDANHRWIGSLGTDSSGNLIMGYSISGAVYPSIGMTSRLVTDSPGTLKAEKVLFSGKGSQQCVLATGECVCRDELGACETLSRWGDYSSLVQDPTDGCVLWFTAEYLPQTGAYNWRTRIFAVRLAECKQ